MLHDLFLHTFVAQVDNSCFIYGPDLNTPNVFYTILYSMKLQIKNHRVPKYYTSKGIQKGYPIFNSYTHAN